MQRSYITVISLISTKNDLAKSWKLLKTIIGKDLKSSLNTTFTINNRIVTDSREIANGFNNYFISIGPLLANDITCSANPLSYVKSIDNSNNNNIYLKSNIQCT